jgi:hypothetical protein
MRLLAAALALASASACNYGPLMDPGEDCMGCHTHQSGESGWTAAGTVFFGTGEQGVADVTVKITDAAGRDVTLTTNAAGNFYTQEPLVLPLDRVEIVGPHGNSIMQADAASGSCNSCHRSGAVGGRLIAR